MTTAPTHAIRSIYDIEEADEPYYDSISRAYIVCNVHASPNCVQPDSREWNGNGWGHDDDMPRIECFACAKVLAS